jgi:hypothetical protein
MDSNNIFTNDFDQRYLYWTITRWTISWFDLKKRTPTKFSK